MTSDLPLYETEINSIIKEYFSYSGLEKAVYALQLECNEKGKPIPVGNKAFDDGSKLTTQNTILQEFDAGNSPSFWRVWEDKVPRNIREKDQTCQRLEFYIQIHFAVFPLRVGRSSATVNPTENAMTVFKRFLETKGSDLSQTTEFLPFYALPFVPNPMQHPSFKEIFSTYWVPDLRARVDRFLIAALSSSEPPILITLVKNKARLSVKEDSGNENSKVLQSQLVQAEMRCSAYMKRFNKLQTDYHTLISITAELVDSLEQTVHGHMVTPEYLQRVCARLLNSRVSGGTVASVDFTRPGTASSLLRASIARESFAQVKDDSALLPSLDYNKIKADLANGSDRTKILLLQALRWRLTRSQPGEQRDTVLLSYIDNDLFTCQSAHDDHFNMLALFQQPDNGVRQYVARLYNALSSLQQGRAYLCLNPEMISGLLEQLCRNVNNIDQVFEEHLLGCLQKLSLRRVLQSVMIKGDLIHWLITILADHDNLSDYMLEYAAALLMNLCLRSTGKRKCGQDATRVLKVLSDLFGHPNQEVRPYINGALFSILSYPVVRKEALEMDLEVILRDFMEGEAEEFQHQLEFIIQQLNKQDNGDNGDNGESGDEGDEDDDEDQDAMEADLDKDEIVQPRGGEVSGEDLLCSEYLGMAASTRYNSNNNHNLQTPRNPVMMSLVSDAGIPTRPLTPSRDLMATPVPRSDHLTLRSSSYTNTLITSSTDLQGSRPQSVRGSRPLSRQSVRSTVKDSIESPTLRQSAVDLEASKLMSQLTGVERHLSLPAQNSLPLPAGKEGTKQGKEFVSAFSSRPRILRTPDTGRITTRGPPPNPTFSTGEPTSRPTSGSSWRGSKGSSSTGGDVRSWKNN